MTLECKLMHNIGIQVKVKKHECLETTYVQHKDIFSNNTVY